MKKQSQTLAFHLKGIWYILKEKFRKQQFDSLKPVSSTKKGIRLLVEVPNNDVKSLKFGHSQIINALKQVIFASQSSVTIGLFGGWGTGKSSIVENLKIKLLNEKVPVVIFDVWKHDGDALRRTFLKDMDLQLSAEPYGVNFVKQTNILNPQVFSAVKDSKEKLSIKTNRFFFNIIILFVLAFVVVSAIFLSCFLFQIVSGFAVLDALIESKFVGGLSAFLATGLTGGLIFKYVDNFIKVEKVESQKEKLQDPHEFEAEFHRLVNNLETEIENMVVVFDNLDRVSGDNVLKIISTIKTFLDFKSSNGTKKVIFLIPCDANALKTHIQISLGNDDPIYIDEFLRKFFNTSIWIPDFYENELEEFATEKLRETGVPEFENEQLAWLVIRAFHKNPRQIVQYINILLSNYLIIKEFCIEGGIQDKDFYNSNLPQLAKFLALKMCFPEIINFYREEGIYQLYDDQAISFLKKDDQFPDYSAFRNLLDRTREIRITNLEPFFKFRLSKDEQDIPELNKILNHIIYGNDNLTLSEDMIVAMNVSALSNAIRNRFQASTNNAIKISITKGILEFAQKVKIVYSNHLYKDILDFILKTISDLRSYDPQLIADELLMKFNTFPISDTRRLMETYRSYFTEYEKNDVFLQRAFEFVIRFKSYLNENDVTNFAEALVRTYKLHSLISTFLTNEEAKAKFLNQRFKSFFIGKMISPTSDEMLYNLTLLPLMDFDNEHKTQVFKNLSICVVSLLKGHAQQEDKTNQIIGLVNSSLMKFFPDTEIESHKMLEPLIRYFILSPEKGRFIPAVLPLLKSKYLLNVVQEYFSSFINNAESKDLESLIESLDLNTDLSEENLLLLFIKSHSYFGLSKKFVNELTKTNAVIYLQVLLERGNYKELDVLWPSYITMSTDSLSAFSTLLLDHAKQHLNGSQIPELKVIISLLVNTYVNCQATVPGELITYLISFLTNDADVELLNFVISCLETLLAQTNIDSKFLTSKLGEQAMHQNIYSVRAIYTLLFGHFEEMEVVAQNQLRDLIYLFLLHNIEADSHNLELAHSVLSVSKEFDLSGCESYFNDFIDLAKSNINSSVSSYYIRIAQLILPKLKKYQSKDFREIKRRLKDFISEYSSE